MFSESMNRRVFLTSAWYDLFVSAPFALPVTLAFVWGFIMTPLHALLGAGALEPLGPYGTLFGNFFGSVVTIWAVIRIRLADTRLALFDGIGRGLFCIAMVNAIMMGASPLLWAFFVPELLFCVLQLGGAYVRRNRQSMPNEQIV